MKFLKSITITNISWFLSCFVLSWWITILVGKIAPQSVELSSVSNLFAAVCTGGLFLVAWLGYREWKKPINHQLRSNAIQEATKGYYEYQQGIISNCGDLAARASSSKAQITHLLLLGLISKEERDSARDFLNSSSENLIGSGYENAIQEAQKSFLNGNFLEFRGDYSLQSGDRPPAGLGSAQETPENPPPTNTKKAD